MIKIKCEVCGREEEQIRLAGNFEICFKCRADTELYLLYSKWKEYRKKEDFFLRYKNKPKLLVEEYPEFKKEVEKFVHQKPEHEIVEDGKYDWYYIDMEGYNRWLFKVAFKGVVNG